MESNLSMKKKLTILLKYKKISFFVITRQSYHGPLTVYCIMRYEM